MKKIRLDAPTLWTSVLVRTVDLKKQQEVREQLLAEISLLRGQLQKQTGTGNLLEISQRQTYKEMINSRQRFIESLEQ